MSFNERERSLATGQPIRLYQFSRGVLRWLYNTSDRNIEVDGAIYRTLRGGIKDGGIRQTGESQQDAFTITAPADIEVAQPFRGVRPSAEIGIRVLDMHYGEAEVVSRFVGTISSVKWPTLDSCQIVCQDIESSMTRPGLTDTYTRTCSTTLYSARCKVSRDAYRVEATVQEIAGMNITCSTAAGFADGYFSAGYVEWAIGAGEYERRHIEVHQGATLQLLSGTGGLSVGMAVRVYPGCDFLASTCHARFSNLPNFRGVPHMDGKSPFDGEQVF